MKAIKLTFIAAAAIMLASCSSSNEKETATETTPVEETVETSYEGVDDTIATAPAAEATETVAKSNSDVDKLLDEYEEYMDQTIKFAKKAQSGDMSAMTEYASLLEKAESLNDKIEKFEGDMTTAQLARFQKIAAKAANAMM